MLYTFNYKHLYCIYLEFSEECKNLNPYIIDSCYEEVFYFKIYEKNVVLDTIL